MHREAGSVLLGLLEKQLQGQPRHAVDPAVAGGDQSNFCPLLGQAQCFGTAVPFPGELAIESGLIRAAQGFQKIEVEAVANPGATTGEGCFGVSAEQGKIAWATAHQVQFSPFRRIGGGSLGNGHCHGTLFPCYRTADLLGLD